MKVIRNFVRRLKLPDTPVGKVVQAIGGLVGLGGGVAIASEAQLFQFTGDTVVDVTIVVVVGIIILITGKVPVPPECVKDLEP